VGKGRGLPKNPPNLYLGNSALEVDGFSFMSASVPATLRTSNPAIRTLLLCDLVASTQLVERVGDSTAAELLARHDRIARDLLSTFNGREIDKSDGFLLLFERPVEAVRFAIAYQSKLRELGAAFDSEMASRVGIHLGEVLLRDNLPEDVARGAKPVEVEGLAKAIAARVMSLAGNGRILITRAAYDFARRAAVGMNDAAPLRWAVHGPYRLAGVEDLVEVCEVAEPGQANLTRPPDSEKAHRADDQGTPPERLDPARTPAPPSGQAIGAMPAEPVLAVLAFDNLSSDPEMQFFSDGVSEEIIQRLSRGAKLKVIGRTSSFQFRGERKAEAARSLDCSHVLDGSIRRAAGRVRISAHLVEASSRTTLWSERYDSDLEDVFAVQDEISESIAGALDQTFSSFSTRAVDPAVYDLYLRATSSSYAPDELRTHVGLLEVVTQRAPHFAEAWGRLAFLRAFLRFYLPFAERAASADLVAREADRALALDRQNIDALMAQLFSFPPFGRFVEADAVLERIQRAPDSGDGRRYIGWALRTMGRVRESLEETERAYRLDALDPMSANGLALARMAAGRVAEAVPIYEDLVERVPEMSFPVSSLLRAYAFQQDWAGVDRLLALAEKRQLREFQDGLPFIRAKRDPTPENIGAWRSALEAQVGRTGSVDVSRLVYSAHLGLVDEAYRAAETAQLGPAGTGDDMMGPDGYRTSLLFQAGMPELRNDPRFARLCARLGLVEFWMATEKWPDCAGEVPYEFKAECAKAQNIPKEDFGF
jgi:TolB-like protein/class 3 adenylate cyclase/tetratricopeptide (TPR) repeat protein